MVKTAREWLAEADFSSISGPLYQSFIEAAGFDKADECREMMRRVAENLLDTLGDVRMTETSVLKLMRAVASISVDHTFPRERREDG